MQPESIIAFTSCLSRRRSMPNIEDDASSPPTVARPRQTPSTTRSDLITTPARIERESPLRKLSAIPSTLMARLFGWTLIDIVREPDLNTVSDARPLVRRRTSPEDYRKEAQTNAFSSYRNIRNSDSSLPPSTRGAFGV